MGKTAEDIAIDKALADEIAQMGALPGAPPPATTEEEVVDENVDDTVEDDDGGSVEDEGDETVEDDTEDGEETDETDEDDEAPGSEVDFRTTLNDMAKEQLGVNEEKVDDTVIAKDIEKQEPIKPEERLVYDSQFDITDDEYTKVFESKEELVKLFQKMDTEFAMRTQQLIRALPGVIRGLANSVIGTRLAVSDFYQANADLVPFKALVEVTTNKLSSKFPEKTVDELMADVGKEVRKTLKLDNTSGGSRVAGKKKRAPAVVDNKGAGTRKPAPPVLTGMEAEIDAMSKYMNRGLK